MRKLIIAGIQAALLTGCGHSRAIMKDCHSLPVMEDRFDCAYP